MVPDRRVLVMTPSRGTCAMGYHKSVLAVVNHRIPWVDFDIDHTWPEDVCKVRARMAEYVRRSKVYSHIFFWDSDVSMTLEMFYALVSSQHPFAVGIYPTAGGTWPFHGDPVNIDGWAQVDRVPLGAACIDLDVIRAVGAKCADFRDTDKHGIGGMIPDIFAHIIDSKTYERLSEDYSFCDRARRSTYPPRILVGHTATHHKMVPLWRALSAPAT